MGKTALVVSGGGSKGAFAVGAIQHLVQSVGVQFDIVCGTSTGALIAPFIVAGEIDELVRFYTTVRTEDIVRRRRLSDILVSDSIFDAQPLGDKVTSAITPARAAVVLASPKQMFLATVCLQTERITYFQSGPPGRAPAGCDLLPIQSRGRLIRAMVASANMPALMPPIELVDGATPVRQYVDGGVRERTPLEMALLNGATDIYAVVLAPKAHAPQEKKFQDVPGILMWTIGTLTDDVLLHDLLVVESAVRGRRYLANVRSKVQTRFNAAAADLDHVFTDDLGVAGSLVGPEVNLHVIRPLRELPIDTLTFDPTLMTALVREGNTRAVVALANPGDWLA